MAAEPPLKDTIWYFMNFDTLLIHGDPARPASAATDPVTGAVNIPVYQTSTYRQPNINSNPKWEYSRSGNPTRNALEELIAALENGVQGYAFASGLAAIATVLKLFKTGDKILCGSDIYGGTFRMLDVVYKPFGLLYEQADTSDLLAVEAAFADDTGNSIKAVLLETPSNPLLKITDIAAVADIARQYGAVTIVDNTFLTPYYQKPLDLGADIVIHSATKYLGGHSDLIAGLAVAKSADIAERLLYLQNAAGAILSPSDSYMLVRSIKTLAVRMEKHVANAKILAEFLRGNKAVSRVYYPEQGAMISFEIKKDPAVFFTGLKLIALAESLGGVESLVCHPASMTHASIPKKIREKNGVRDSLIRFSVGIENPNDLIEDLTYALR